MESFKIDNRNRNDLIKIISEHAASYTPEWKFDVSNPDATSVIGMIYANQTLNNIKNLNRLFTKYHIEFANMYGISLKSATPARTICTFTINENIFSGSELKKGTQVIGSNDDGDEKVFALSHDICITTSQLTDVMMLSGKNKYMKIYGEDDSKGIRLFDYTKGNSYVQSLEIEFDKLPRSGKNLMSLKFNGDIPSTELAGIFSDTARYGFKYIYMGEEHDFKEVSVNGELVELSAKISGDDKGDDKGIIVIVEQKKPVQEEFILENIELFIKNNKENAGFLWNGKNEISDNVFLPFSNQPTLYNEFYIGDSFIFGQHGAKAVMHFKLDFDTYKVNETAVYEEDLRIIKKKNKSIHRRPHYYSYVQEISFDYFNGKGWKHLETDRDLTVLFSKEDNAGEYEVRFKIPYDWESVVVGGYEGSCIRMQVIKADNCYINDVEYYYPVISDFRLYMDNGINGIQPSEITYVHGKIREKDITKAFGSMEYDGDYMLLGFDKRFVNGPVGVFADIEKSNLYKGLELEFSYSSQKGFKPLKVVDDTNMFQNSGIIMFMPPIDMCEYEVEGNRKFWIRIEDRHKYFADKGSCTPVLKNIFLNAAYAQNTIENDEQDYYIDAVTSHMKFPLYAQNILSVKIWVNEKEQLSNEEMDLLVKDDMTKTRTVCNLLGEIEEFYVLWQEVENFDDANGIKRCFVIDRNKNEVVFGDGVTSYVPQNTLGVAFKAQVTCCDGESANIGAGTIDRFRSSIISIEDVTNPIGAYGGTDIEDINDALIRGSNILSSRKRLVSKNDYIKETYLFSDTIVQVACVTDDIKGISLVLLMKDYKKGDYSFRNIQEKLKNHLLENCEMTCGINDIQISEPIFVEISIDLWIKVPDMAKGMEIKQFWLDSITSYLEPVKSETSSGWQIGKLPTSNQIRLMLSTLEGTTAIENVNIMASYTKDGRYHEIGLDRIEKNPFMICSSGNHNIYINGI